MNAQRQLVATTSGNTVYVKDTNGSGVATWNAQGGSPDAKLTHALLQGDEVHCYWSNGRVGIHDIWGSGKRIV
jgi:hypothetical protein